MPTEGVEKDKGNDNTENGDGDENHNEIQVEEYNNCTHGDLADYTCVECLYNRWRSQANIKKPAHLEDSVVIIDDEEIPGRLQGITIEKVAEKVNITEKESAKVNDNANINDLNESKDLKGDKSEGDDDQESSEEEDKEGGETEINEKVVNPVEIISSVNWLEVFKIAGISIPVINVE